MVRKRQRQQNTQSQATEQLPTDQAALNASQNQLVQQVSDIAVKQMSKLKDNIANDNGFSIPSQGLGANATGSFTSSSSSKQNVAFRPFKIQKQCNSFADQGTQTANKGLAKGFGSNHNSNNRYIKWTSSHGIEGEEVKQNEIQIGEVAEEEKDEVGEGESSSLMNLSNTPINFGTNDQEVQLIKKCGNSSSSSQSRNASSRCRSVIRSSKSSSFDSARLMYLNRYDTLGHLKRPKIQTSKPKKSRVNKRQPSYDIFSSNERVSSISFESQMQANCAIGHHFGDDGTISMSFNDVAPIGEMLDEEGKTINAFEIFADYDENLDIMESLQKAQLENDSQVGNRKEERTSRRHSQSSSCLNTNNSQELCQHQDLHEVSPDARLEPLPQIVTEKQMPQLQRIQYQQNAVQAFAQDQSQIRQLLTHCLYCIYRQQGLEKYFREMVTVGRLVRAYWITAKDLPPPGSENRCHLQEQLHAQTQPSYLRDMLASIIDDIMKSICSEITQKMRQLGVIVKEPLIRRASADDYQLCFDYFSRRNANCHNLMNGSCFGPHSLGNCSVFTNNVELRNLATNDDEDCCISSTYSDLLPEEAAIGDQQLDEFTVIQETLKKKRKLLGGLCGHWQAGNQCGQANGNSNHPQYQLNTNGTGLNTQLLVAYKQQQEMYLDSKNSGYEFIRAEGKRGTWHDIKSSRVRLQKFLYRQQEYKQVFDMIMRSYQQLQDSFEYLEELWIYLYEAIYDKSQGGKLQFDKIWKDLFLERVLDNKYIKHFLNDVSDQQEYLLNYNQVDTQKQNRNSRYILDEIYCNLEKLESDINHDYVMDDLTNFISLDEAIDSAAGSLAQQAASQDLIQSAHQQLLNSQLTLVIQNQYEILQEKFRLKYGGQTLCQLVNACHEQQYSDTQALKYVQQVVLKTCEIQEQLGQAQQAVKAQQQHQAQLSSAVTQTGEASPSKKRKRRKTKKKKNTNEKDDQQENMQPDFDDDECPEPTPKNKEELQQETQALFRKLMTQKQKMKSQQKPKTKTKEELAVAQAEEERKRLEEEERLRREAAEFEEALKLSKKKKLNQKKKRQRNQKKKRMQEQQEAALLQTHHDFDYRDFMSDPQLRLLISRYDANMSSNDVEYLMQMEDRERVITTLCAKLVEREQLQEYEYDDEEYADEDDDDTLGQQFGVVEDFGDGQYDFSTETQRVNKLMTAFDVIYPMNSQLQNENDNGIYFEDVTNIQVNQGNSDSKAQQQRVYSALPTGADVPTSNSISPVKRSKKKAAKLSSHASQVDSNFKVTNWNQRAAEAAQHNIEIIDQVAVLSHQRSSTRDRVVDDGQSKISFEEEIYDDEFERELKHFQRKLQSQEECSLERTYCYPQRLTGSSQRKGSRGSSRTRIRKLVPNVSTEWINELKEQLKMTMQKTSGALMDLLCTGSLNKSLDHRRSSRPPQKDDYSNQEIEIRQQSVENCRGGENLAIATQTTSSGTARRGERLAPPDRNGYKQDVHLVPQMSLKAHNYAMTNSTAGMSFCSPRIADQNIYEDEIPGIGFVIGSSTTYEEDGNQRLSIGAPYPGAAATQTTFGDGQTAAAGLFLNGQDEQMRDLQDEAVANQTDREDKGAEKGTGKKRHKKNKLSIEMQHQSA